jgi:hypothetical protein
LVFVISTIMKKPQNDEIPVTKLIYNTVYTDFHDLDGELKIVYTDPKCILTTLNGTPWMLFVTPDFNQNDLISAVGDHLFEVKRLCVQSTFNVDSKSAGKLLSMPDWLIAFKNVEWLRFDSLILDELWLLKDLPLKELCLNKIAYQDEVVLLNSISRFKDLTELTYDESLTDTLVCAISAAKPNLKLSFEV